MSGGDVSDVLRDATVTVVDHAMCKRKYDNIVSVFIGKTATLNKFEWACFRKSVWYIVMD